MKVIKLSKKEARQKLGRDYIFTLMESSVQIDSDVASGFVHRFDPIIDDGDFLKLYLDDVFCKVMGDLGVDPYRILNKDGEVLETEVIDED